MGYRQSRHEGRGGQFCTPIGGQYSTPIDRRLAGRARMESPDKISTGARLGNTLVGRLIATTTGLLGAKCPKVPGDNYPERRSR